MKKLKMMIIGIASLLSLSLVVIFCFAWYMDNQFHSLDGRVKGAYFAGGNGSAESPYLLTNRIHMYNLAWLQYLGTFNTQTEEDSEGTKVKQYYFEVADGIDNIDMNGLAIPPIGTEKYPFIGHFDGKDCVISNAVTSNNLTTLKTRPALESFDDLGAIVGFFGVVGDSGSLNLPEGATYSSKINSVANFDLDNVQVESSASSTLIGIVAGYAGATLQNIGVTYSQIQLSKVGISHLENQKVSEYALIGSYDTNKLEWQDRPGAGGPGYGTATDLAELNDRMISLFGASELANKQYLPFQGTGEAATSDGSIVGEKAADNNMGYYIGGDLKINTKHKQNIDLTSFYHPAGATKSIFSLPYQDYDQYYEAPDQNIIDATFNSPESEIYTLRLQSKIDTHNNLVTIENGTLWGKQFETIIVPRRCIWFVPQKTGTLKFIIVNPNNGENFTLSYLTRSAKITHPDGTVTGDYSSSMTDPTAIIDANTFGGLTYGTGEIRLNNEVYNFEKDMGLAYYFTVEITQEMIDDCYEFVLSRDTGSDGAYFWYLDIGAAGGSSQEYSGEITDVDFVYDTSLNIADDLSDVLFAIDGTSSNAVVFYFRRKKNGETDIVYYFVEPEENGLALTLLGNGDKQQAKTADCES